MKTQIPSFKFSLILFLILILPYKFKLFFTEPFPAIILPSGHGKIAVNDTVVKNYEYAFEVFNEGNKIEVEGKNIFLNVPERFHSYFINNDLGFCDSIKNLNNENDFKYKILPWKKNKCTKKEELKD